MTQSIGLLLIFFYACIFLQNRLLAMNYINEGNDDKLFEAHRFVE